MTPIPPWLRDFDGDMTTDDSAAILATVDEAGWPHVSYLSQGEVLAHPGGISIALWPQARTTANIRRTGQAVLHVAADGAVWEARLHLAARPETAASGLALFDGEIRESRRHAAPYADVMALVRFHPHDPGTTRQRWRDQLSELARVTPSP